MQKVILIVLDSVGIGALPDAPDFGDEGSNTLCHIDQTIGGLKIPNLIQMGIGNIEGVKLHAKCEKPIACFGRCAEKFYGKDTTGGHWEICGLILDKPFPTYPHGFPAEIIDAFEKRIGRKTLGNYPASGTVIIEELGEEHQRTGWPIVYTSADSVFQIACHEETVSVEELYRFCRIARELLVGDHMVGRVIARPFIGTQGHYIRTSKRKDFSVAPPKDTILTALQSSGKTIAAVGKIEDIFANRGITLSNHTTNNLDGIAATISFMQQPFTGLIFTNLVDFDSLYGHRNDISGYAKALEEFDEKLPELIANMGQEDILVITADHGCDPTTPSTDHSREYIPLLVYSKMMVQGKPLGTRETFADIAATIGDVFQVPWHTGNSFYKLLFGGI